MMTSTRLDIINDLRAHWRNLQPRERLLVGAGGIFAAAALLYALLWVPMTHEISRLRTAVPAAQAQLRQMQAQLAEVKQLKASPAARRPTSDLRAVVEQSAAANGMKKHVTRLEERGEKAVKLALDGVSFNSLISWLSDLQKQSALRVESATVQSHSAPGLVDARLVLHRGGT